MSVSSDPDPKPNFSASGSGRTPWYEDLRVLGILLVLIGVFALPLVWFNKRMTLEKKLVITAVSVAIAAVLFWISSWGFNFLNQRLSEVQETRRSIAAESGARI